MTTEQKAKAYDEALERAKAILKVADNRQESLDYVSTIFPELAEREDEKIRKEIIQFVQSRLAGFPECERFLTWLEKQGKQKPADKVEAKFKVRDWCIDNEDGTIFQIVKVLDNTYMYKTNEGKEYSSTRYSLENDARLWTIQDAKDGDVLVFKNNIGGIIICKSPSDYDTRSYCRLIRDNLINEEESGWDSTLLVPATKEQRDTLEKAMAVAGYEWDADKKELKKIKVKTLDADKVIEWLEDQACQGWIEDVEVDKFVDKFEEDFGL